MTPNFTLSALYALDNLEVMRGMDSESVPLIYADPPFNSKRIYQGMSGSKAAPHRFRDTWSWNDAKQEWLDQLENDQPELYKAITVAKSHSPGMSGYCAFMAVRLIEMHRILTPDGSLYLHCDAHANSYLRMLLDIVFGGDNYQNDIIWQRTTAHNDAKRYGANTDTIIFYTKSDKWIWNEQPQPYDDKYKARFRHKDPDGRAWSDDNLTAKSLAGGGYEYEYKGVTSLWRVPLETMRQLDAEGRLHFHQPGWDPAQTIFGRNAGPSDSIPLDGHICPQFASQGTHRLENPEARWRCWNASSKPAATRAILCSTRSAAAAPPWSPRKKLGRRWVGADDDANAIDVVRERVASLKGTVADRPQLQNAVAILRDPPERTAEYDRAGVLRDPTGYIIPKMPSDKMSRADIRAKLLEWQADANGVIQCPGCGELLKARHFDVDHIDPKSTGGSNRIDNRILLCGACNTEKSDGKTLAALWRDHGIAGKERRDMQECVKAIREKARAHVQELDAGYTAALQARQE